MARKRRYYREDRRYPAWPDDFEDDWEEEEPDDPVVVQRTMKVFGWGFLAFMVVGAILAITQPSTIATHQEGTEEGYRVVAVSNGKLHTIDQRTGKQVSFADQQLVRQALDGSIKRGDVIFR